MKDNKYYIECIEKNLETLYLSYNQIKKIEPLNENLITLDLDNNEITKIENLNEKLEVLYLLDNPITKISRESYDLIKENDIFVYGVDIEDLEIEGNEKFSKKEWTDLSEKEEEEKFSKEWTDLLEKEDKSKRLLDPYCFADVMQWYSNEIPITSNIPQIYKEWGNLSKELANSSGKVINKNNNKKNMTIKQTLKRIFRSEEDKNLIKVGVTNEEMDLTEYGKDYLLEVLFADKDIREKMDKEIASIVKEQEKENC